MSRPEMGVDLAKALQEAHRGDPEARETLFKECYPKVRRVVRRKLNRSLRSLYDSTDFASDVMKSLAAHFDQLQFPSIDSLLAFLAQVAEQKVIDEYRRRHTLKRDITRERPIAAHDADSGPVQLPSDEPTASQLAQANEVHEWLLARSDETEREIIELKQLGYTTADIAERTGWNPRKVQRFLKDLLDSMQDSGG
jgi:RNA polymerase sigma factor (sigma-70 family)